MATSMPKPKARSRYIRRMNKLEERVRRSLVNLRELQAFLHNATIEEVRASLMPIPPEDTPL